MQVEQLMRPAIAEVPTSMLARLRFRYLVALNEKYLTQLSPGLIRQNK